MIDTIIDNFHNLQRPHSDSGGIKEKDWCVCTVANGGLYYLLNSGSLTLVNILNLSSEDTNKIYFDTEAACHEHADDYYTKHCTRYPYVKEWSDCVPTAIDDPGSRVMDFI